MSNTNEMRLINVIVTANFLMEEDERSETHFVCSEIFTDKGKAVEWIFNYMEMSNAVLHTTTDRTQYWCSREKASRYNKKQNCYFVDIVEKKLNPKVLTIAQAMEYEIKDTSR